MTEKGKFLQKLNQAFANSDTSFVAASVTDDIVWNLVGDYTIEGKENFEKSLQEMLGIETLDMQIENTITHGKTASVNGTMKIKENDEIKSFGFCDIYEFDGFKNAKIKKMTSYVIQLKS